ncbi:hypothetical protein MWU49_05955 [Alcanivorax sp. S6407]|uniref:hypothetical protein n=1 Tax=Alcanivorax sp. S6407 TaxID=2926424 RepID=UPI001FF10D34|nr:hypothetical protein [Alcanivorax sp. S6407]MCK0153234.1 hypothetical protein [Alcanivorax sp. S6407]
MKYLALASFAIALAGCQHLSYQPPYGEDTAKITFTTNGTPAQPVVCVPGKGFQPTEFSLARTPMGGDAMNDLMQTLKKSPTVTTKIAPSSQARVGVIYNQKDTNSSRRDRCKIALQFEAVAGESYKADFNYSADQCGLAITDSEGQSADAVQIDWQCP